MDLIERRRAMMAQAAEEHDYSQDYMTFTFKENGNWRLVKNSTNSSTPTIQMQYSTDGGTTWTSYTSATSSTATRVNVSAGDVVLFRNTATKLAYSNSYYNMFSVTGSFDLSGNVMSMINSSSFKTLSTFSANYPLSRLFYSCSALVNAENLILPVTNFGTRTNVYAYMFRDCRNLVTAPKLPATTLYNYCYYYMFYACTSLKEAPALPATTTNNYCYSYMFQSCSNLETAPELPADMVASSAYNSMFRACGKLNHVTCLATRHSASNCTANWLNGVSSTGTFTQKSAASWSRGASGIPTNWTVTSV